MNIITNTLNSAAIITLLFAFLIPYVRKWVKKGSVIERTSWESRCRQIVWLLVPLAVLRQFIGELYIIPSGSMEPNLVIGDQIIVDKTAYSLKVPFVNSVMVETGDPDRGDVVLFHFPLDPDKVYIKRLIGKPGDTISFEKGKISITPVEGKTCRVDLEHKAFEMWQSGNEQYVTTKREDSLDPIGQYFTQEATRALYSGLKVPSFKVPDGAYFVLGDNRINSMDSRMWGMVEERLLIGKAERVLLTIEYADGSGWLPKGMVNGVSFKRSFLRVGEFFDEGFDSDMITKVKELEGVELCQ